MNESQRNSLLYVLERVKEAGDEHMQHKGTLIFVDPVLYDEAQTMFRDAIDYAVEHKWVCWQPSRWLHKYTANSIECHTCGIAPPKVIFIVREIGSAEETLHERLNYFILMGGTVIVSVEYMR